MTSSSSLQQLSMAGYLQIHKNFRQTKTHLQMDFHRCDSNPILLQKAAKTHRSIPPKLKRFTLSVTLDENSRLLLYSRIFKKNLQHVEHLKITFCPSYGYQSPSNFAIVIKILQRLRNLQVLEIIVARGFGWNKRISMQSLTETLSKSSQRLRDVKIIYEEGYGDDLDDGRFKPLLNVWRIQRLKTLQSLTLHLPRGFITIKNENEGKLDVSALSKLRKLKFLDLGMVLGPHCKKIILEPSRLLPNLKLLKWSIADDCWAEIYGQRVNQPFYQVVRLHERLLGARWTAIEELHFLGSQLARTFQIPPENLTLKFKQNGELDNNDLRIITRSFATLKTDLNQLRLECQKLDNEGRKALISLLENPKLRRMNVLCLDSLNGNDGFLMKLGKAVSPELRFLRLGLEHVKKENVKGFAGIWKRISGGEERITEKGVSKFWESLSEKCKNLKFVWLDIGIYEQISDEGVASLCESLGKIESLKKVWLRFRQYNEVTMNILREKWGEKIEAKLFVFV